jgi:dipeptidyl-peptidase-4
MIDRTLPRLLSTVLALSWILGFSAATPSAQRKQLTLDDIYDPATRTRFSGTPESGFVWIDAAHYAWPRRGDARDLVDWMKVSVTTGEAEPLFAWADLEAAVANLPGLTATDGRRVAHSADLVFNRSFSAALAAIDNDLYLYSPAGARLTRLTRDAADEEVPTFSPDGSTVAFVRKNDLFVVDLVTLRETALTADGSDRVFNGTFDWVYEEEIYGRGEKQAYWWSPDSSRLAFLRIDDTPVSTFVTVDDIPYDQKVETWYYPKAGEPNPLATLGIVSAAGGPVRWVDTSGYPRGDHLLVRVGWTPDSRQIVYEVQNRTQTWLDLNLEDLKSGAARTVFQETSRFWIGADEAAVPTWLEDGSFLWSSARSGWTHLYHYRSDGTLIRQVTDGKWEVRALHGVDERGDWVYFSGTERSHIGSDVYRVRLDGTGFERVSEAAGTHGALFSPDFAHFIDTWSDVTMPPQVRLHRSDGSEVRVIDRNPMPALAEYDLSKPEFLQVETRDGFLMEAMLVKPPDFVPSRRYPVYQFVYGGPEAPQVRNAWGGAQYLYHQLLAQQGILVWICDNRTASGKGAESAWPVHRRFGESELRDIEDGLSWLKRQPYVDPSRIGIHGWSYGGFVTTYALTHSTSFVMGIAGGTVSDWRDYDTVYTERFLGLPQDNAEGYRASSPRWDVGNLHGALLLIHGAIDDNVHVQNTMQLAYELQQANKPFRLMIYPKSRHGVTDPALVRHMRGLMLDFVLEHLKPGGTASAGTASR